MNKLILQPKDYFVSSFGLKLENTGDMVIELEMPTITIYPVSKPVIKNISVEESNT